MSKPVFGTALLVHGPESILAERAVANQVTAAKREQPEAEINRVEALTLDAGTFHELAGGSLFASHQVVVLEDVSGLDQSLFDLVVATASQPEETLVLVLVHPGGNKGKGLVDKLKKAKVPLVEAKPIKAWELPKFVQAEAKRHRLTMGTDAVEALVSAVGQDARALASAVEQLADDVPDGNASLAHVTRYFSGRNDVSSFAIADDIMLGRRADALLKLRWALDTGVAPVLITAAVASSVRALGKYHDLRGTRMSEADMAREVGVPPFKVKQLNQQSRGWSGRALAQAVREVAVADAAVKGAAHDPSYALERMLTQIDEARRAD